MDPISYDPQASPVDPISSQGGIPRHTKRITIEIHQLLKIKTREVLCFTSSSQRKISSLAMPKVDKCMPWYPRYLNHKQYHINSNLLMSNNISHQYHHHHALTLTTYIYSHAMSNLKFMYHTHCIMCFSINNILRAYPIHNNSRTKHGLFITRQSTVSV